MRVRGNMTVALLLANLVLPMQDGRTQAPSDPTQIEPTALAAARQSSRQAGVERGVHQPSRPEASAYGSRTETHPSRFAPRGMRESLRLMTVLDSNLDGFLTANEIEGASENLRQLDSNLDGMLSSEELQPRMTLVSAPVSEFAWGSPPSGSNPQRNRVTEEDFVHQIMSGDLDGDGEIEPGELTDALSLLSASVDQDSSKGIDSQEATTLYQTVGNESIGRELYSALVADEQVDLELIEKINTAMDEQAAVEAEIRSANSHRENNQSLLYWFTVGAMVLSVLGFGHLLTDPPRKQGDWREVYDKPTARRGVVYCVAFIAGLSGMDLVWTMLASGNSHFVELNPFGAKLLGDYSIAVFKLFTLVLAVVLFLRLQRFRGAQIGSWWMCLVHVLLTWRWLVAESMFIG